MYLIIVNDNTGLAPLRAKSFKDLVHGAGVGEICPEQQGILVGAFRIDGSSSLSTRYPLACSICVVLAPILLPEPMISAVDLDILVIG